VLALSFALFAPGVVLATPDAPRVAVLPAVPTGVRAAAAAAVTPTSFIFSELPQRVPDEQAAVSTPRGHLSPELAAELQRLKAHPPGLAPAAFAKFTLDPTAPPASAGKGTFAALAPSVGNGFEGITQQGFVPACPTVGAGPLNIFSCGNVSVTVTNKDGSSRVETSGSTFFNAPSAEGPVSEAQSFYDAVHGRFVAL